jgi:hypothetical protein
MLLYSMMVICSTIIRAVPTVLDLPIIVGKSKSQPSLAWAMCRRHSAP